MAENEKQVTDKGAVTLEEGQLDQAAGGASDYLLELDGIKAPLDASLKIKFDSASPQLVKSGPYVKI